MTEGASFAERTDSISSGIAISLFQDSVELFIWTIVKDRGIKEGNSFTANIDALKKDGVVISHTAKLMELNKARVGFKHYGNLPAPDEAGKFLLYVEDFLRTSFIDHFSINFDELSLVDLVSFDDVRERLKNAEKLVTAEEFEKSASEAAIAKTMLFSRIDPFVPKVDQSLRDMDSVIERILNIEGTRYFQYLTNYLELLRETALASLLKLPLHDYTFVSTRLPSAFLSGNGEWRIHRSLRRYDASQCKKAITCLVDIAIRMESLI